MRGNGTFSWIQEYKCVLAKGTKELWRRKPLSVKEKNVGIGFDGITSVFSVKPIRMITTAGILIAFLSFAGVIYKL